MDNISDIRNYMTPDKLEALEKSENVKINHYADELKGLAKRDNQTLPDEDAEHLAQIVLFFNEIFEIFYEKYPKAETPTKIRACYEVITSIIALEDRENWRVGKEMTRSWFDNFEHDVDLKRTLGAKK